MERKDYDKYKIVTIPDDLLTEAYERFLKGGHLDSPGEKGYTLDHIKRNDYILKK